MQYITDFKEFFVNCMDFDGYDDTTSNGFCHCWYDIIDSGWEYYDDNERHYYGENSFIQGYIHSFFNNIEKEVVQEIGMYKILMELYENDISLNPKILTYEIYQSADDEDDFYDRLLLRYFYCISANEVYHYAKQKYIFYRRLHYNRYLNKYNFPNDICKLIKSYL